jgi:undecaprenyl-diphosphatase
MASDLDTGRDAKPVTEVGRVLLDRGGSGLSTLREGWDTGRAAALERAFKPAMRNLGRRLAIFRRNVAATRAFAARRRRDRRFPVQPYDRLQIANAAAVAATALALLAILFDPYLTLWRSGLPHEVVGVFKFVTQFGKSDWILVGSGLAVIIGLFLDPSVLSRKERVGRTVRVSAAAYVFLAVALSGTIANICKNIIGRARPKLFETDGSFAFHVFAWQADWASFPSGHATTGLAFGVALALLFPRLTWIFLCLGFWIAVSRGFVGAHYPSDMLAGGLLGAATAWLVARAFARFRLIFGFDDRGQLVRRKGASGRLA